MGDDKYYSMRLPLRYWCIIAYVISLFLPAKTDSGEFIWCFGIHVFFASVMYWGWIYLAFSWLANLLFGIALFINPIAGRAFSILAGIIALSALLNDFTRRLVNTQYFLWMGSMFMFAFACHLQARTLEKQKGIPTEVREISQDHLELKILSIPFLFMILCGFGLLVAVFALILMAVIAAAK